MFRESFATKLRLNIFILSHDAISVRAGLVDRFSVTSFSKASSVDAISFIVLIWGRNFALSRQVLSPLIAAACARFTESCERLPIYSEN